MCVGVSTYKSCGGRAPGFSLPLSAREDAALMDSLSFSRWLDGGEGKTELDRADNPCNHRACTSGCAFPKPLAGTFASRFLFLPRHIFARTPPPLPKSTLINKQTRE